jgi:uncharacterized protein (TIGR00255 family)
VAVEVRSVNGRFFKMTTKMPAWLSAREPQLEALVKEHVLRGSVTMTVFFRRTDIEHLAAIDEEMVIAYQTAFRRLGLAEDAIPLLKGVIGSAEPEMVSDDEWRTVEAAVREALAAMAKAREREGRALQEVLLAACNRLAGLHDALRERTPQLPGEVQARLHHRLTALLAGSDVAVDPQMVAREVAVLADRSDVSEEMDRLAAHIEHTRELLDDGKGAGRKLEFIAQEMLREVNTMGSKSSDVTLARLVIELKTVIEQLKEQLANIE